MTSLPAAAHQPLYGVLGRQHWEQHTRPPGDQQAAQLIEVAVPPPHGAVPAGGEVDAVDPPKEERPCHFRFRLCLHGRRNCDPAATGCSGVDGLVPKRMVPWRWCEHRCLLLKLVRIESTSPAAATSRTVRYEPELVRAARYNRAGAPGARRHAHNVLYPSAESVPPVHCRFV